MNLGVLWLLQVVGPEVPICVISSGVCRHMSYRVSGSVNLLMLLRTDMHRITSENFFHFGGKFCVQLWTYKCKLSQSAKSHISVTSLF